MNTMADGARDRLVAQIGEALFGQPGLTLMELAEMVKGMRDGQWDAPRCFVSMDMLAGSRHKFGEAFDHPKGSFVRYEDHVRAIAAAQPSPAGQGDALGMIGDNLRSLLKMNSELSHTDPMAFANMRDEIQHGLQLVQAARQPVGEPVAVVTSGDRFAYGKLNRDLPDGTPLYAAPPALAVGQEPERRAPVQGYHGKTIPWRVHGLAWEAYAKEYGNRQSAERLSERGGFSCGEMDRFLPGWREMAESASTQAVDLGQFRELASEMDRFRTKWKTVSIAEFNYYADRLQALIDSHAGREPNSERNRLTGAAQVDGNGVGNG